MDIHPRISKVTTCRSKMTALKHPKSYSYTYVHLSQPGTGNNDFFLLSFFHFDHHFFGLKIVIPFLTPFICFMFFLIPVFPPCGIFMFPSFASKMVLGPWELPPGVLSRTLSVSFHFVSFVYGFG